VTTTEYERVPEPEAEAHEGDDHDSGHEPDLGFDDPAETASPSHDD
jgi:hypothetical protein